MKAVLQRVISASVAVDGKTISSIGKGLLVLVGIDRYDTPQDSTTIIKKILAAKLFDDDNEVVNGNTEDQGRGEAVEGKSRSKAWKKSVKDIDGEVLCVSQFTLLATLKKGSNPDFHESMSTIPSKAYYLAFLEELRKAYKAEKIKDGEFGAMMQVSLCNDGPVTILLDSLETKSGNIKSRETSSLNTPSGSSTPIPPLLSSTGITKLEAKKTFAGSKADRAKKWEGKGVAAQIGEGREQLKTKKNEASQGMK